MKFLVDEIEALFRTSSDAIFPTRKDDLEGAARSTPARLLTRDVTLPLLGISANQALTAKEVHGYLVREADSAIIWGKSRNNHNPHRRQPSRIFIILDQSRLKNFYVTSKRHTRTSRHRSPSFLHIPVISKPIHCPTRVIPSISAQQKNPHIDGKLHYTPQHHIVHRPLRPQLYSRLPKYPVEKSSEIIVTPVCATHNCKTPPFPKARPREPLPLCLPSRL